MVRQIEVFKERHSGDPKTSVRAPPKKAGGGGKFTMGKLGDNSGGATVNVNDPNFDPDERRVDPDDGISYNFDDLAAYYKGKFSKQAIAEYWEYECSTVTRKARKPVAQKPAGPSLQESAAQARYRPKAKSRPTPKRLEEEDLVTDGRLAKEVAEVIPYFPFRKLDKFYDVQGLMMHPRLFNAVCAVIGKRFRKAGVTKAAGFEAVGFLFAAVAVRVGVPFVMLTKSGRMPNAISSTPHNKDVDAVHMQRGAVKEGDKVALISDVLASGETLCAGMELIRACKAEVVECTCVVELKALSGREKCLEGGAKSVWSFISEDLLTTKAELPEDYTDDSTSP